MRVLDGLMTALFAMAVAVQFNDPDPLYWMLLYTPPLVLAAMALGGTFRARPTLVAFAAYLVLAFYHLPAFAHARLASLDSFHMHSVADEEVREAGGVVLCALWTGVLALRARRAGA